MAENDTAETEITERSSAKPKQQRSRRSLTSKQKQAELKRQRERLESEERKIAARERREARAARTHAIATFGAMLVSVLPESNWMTMDPNALLAYLTDHRDEIRACATWPVPEDGDAELAGRRLRAWEAERREADKAARIQRAAEVVAAQAEDEETPPPPEGTEDGGGVRWAATKAMDIDGEDANTMPDGALFDPDSL